MASVFLLTVILSGCFAHVDKRNAPLARNLPPPSVLMQPVPLPPIRKVDVRIILDEHRGALVKANNRLVKSRAWYESIRTEYGGAE